MSCHLRPGPLIPSTEPFPDRLMAKTSFFALAVSHMAAAAGIRRARCANRPSAAPRAAVVFVHGSGGVDSRGECYANALSEAGFVTLEIDLWAARGINSPRERPRHPAETLPDAFAALDFLEHRSGVDPARIGIMGFSWGGIVSMLSATTRAQTTFAKDGQTFAAHAPFYPVCWLYNHVRGI